MARTNDARARIVRAAMDLFHGCGYNASSVQDICAAADVRKGSFYHFFPSKRDLALEVLDSWWVVYRDQVYGPAFKTDVPPLERIGRLFRMAADVQGSNRDSDSYVKGCALGNLAMELSTQEPAIRQRCAEIFDGCADFFEKALRELADGPEVRVRAEALVAYFQGAILLAKVNNDQDIINAMIAGAHQIAAPFGTREPALY